MARVPIGTLFAGQSIRPFVSVATPFNPTADWGAAYALAHPRNANATLVCDFHSKVFLSASGRFFYPVTITNIGPMATVVDLDI
jgi:hypothetical protein